MRWLRHQPHRLDPLQRDLLLGRLLVGCSWVELGRQHGLHPRMFLKYLDGLEDDRAAVAALEGRSYSPILEEPFRWSRWAAPKNASGQLDHHAALTGDDLRDFVNAKLFPYLERFKQSASGPNTIEYMIGEIFGELRNKISSGYNLREIIDGLDGLRFRSQAEKHELSMLYEEKIKRMGNAGRNGGEYYTPRPLIRAIVQVVNPKIGETVYDPAVGSAGFLCEAFEFMRKGGSTGAELSTADLDTLQFLHWRTDFSCIGGETSLARTAFKRFVCLPVAPSIA